MAVIEVRRLRKRYGETVAVADVSFDVAAGEVFGIVGRSGAGKTTIVECVVGLRTPDAGTVEVLGLDPRRDRAEVRQRVGVRLQDSSLPDRITVAEALRLYASFYPRPADPRDLADRLGLGPVLRQRYGRLSGGQQQRLAIALALVGEPSVVVLDESTTGPDPQARRETWDLIEGIRAGGTTVLMVTRLMAEAERLCDRVAVIDAGRVVAVDTPGRLVSTVDGEQRISFRPSVPVDEAVLAGLPEVTSVRRAGNELRVVGGGNVLAVVIGRLAADGIVAEHLRVDQPSPDDAYPELTTRGADD